MSKKISKPSILFLIVVFFIVGCGGGGAIAPGQLATKAIEARELQILI